MDRRDLLRTGTALLGFGALRAQLAGQQVWAQPPANAREPAIETISPHVGICHDVVNVGLIQQNGKVLLIDCGQGEVLAGNSGIGRIDSVLCTHHHRDQCSGAHRLRDADVKVIVPASEASLFRDATQFWLAADNVVHHRHNFRPDTMVLRESLAPDAEARPGETLDWEGIPIHVVATPGHTDGSVSYVVEIDGTTVAFTGDLIYGPGQVWEFYSLQKRFPGMAGDYWGFGGAVEEMIRSLGAVLSYKPSILVPSHGKVINDPAGAVELLKQRLDGVMRNYFTLAAWRVYEHQGVEVFKEDVPSGSRVPMLDPLPSVKLPAWLHRTVETSSYIVAEDKSIFLFDCGFPPIIEALDELVKSAEISRVDAIWVSHYHDDHVVSVNEVRRKYGAKVYAQKELRDILENPTAYRMPCLFPESIHVDRALSEGEVTDWKGYKLTAYYFPGQTLYHGGLLLEHDSARVLMTGDSIANWGLDDYCSYNRNFVGRDGLAAGYERCLNLVLKLKPDLLCAAHWGAEPVSEAYLLKTLDLLHQREQLLNSLFPWDDPNYGLDPNWIVAYPFRQTCLPGQRVTLEARIYNHSSSPRTASLELRTPKGWSPEHAGSINIPAHSEGRLRLAAMSPKEPTARRQVLGLDVHFNGHHVGEVAEAIVDYLD